MDFFNFEIQERKKCVKKILIVLFATRGGMSLISFTSVKEVPAGMASASLTLIFSVTAGIIKELLQVTRKRKNIMKFL